MRATRSEHEDAAGVRLSRAYHPHNATPCFRYAKRCGSGTRSILRSSQRSLAWSVSACRVLRIILNLLNLVHSHVKVIDEFTVPLCHEHLRVMHRYGNELAWCTTFQIAPIVSANELWQTTLVASF